MTDEKEIEEIKTEAEEISRELCTVFETHFKNMIRTEDKMREIVYDIALKTLVSKTNRKEAELKQQKELIRQAKQHLEESPPDYHLANYVLRDSPLVRKNKDLRDFSWAIHQSSSVAKDDVLSLIELIEKEMEK